MRWINKIEEGRKLPFNYISNSYKRDVTDEHIALCEMQARGPHLGTCTLLLWGG